MHGPLNTFKTVCILQVDQWFSGFMPLSVVIKVKAHVKSRSLYAQSILYPVLYVTIMALCKVYTLYHVSLGGFITHKFFHVLGISKKEQNYTRWCQTLIYGWQYSLLMVNSNVALEIVNQNLSRCSNSHAVWVIHYWFVRLWLTCCKFFFILVCDLSFVSLLDCGWYVVVLLSRCDCFLFVWQYSWNSIIQINQYQG